MMMTIITSAFIDKNADDDFSDDFFDDVADVENCRKIETKFISFTSFLFFCSSSSHEFIKTHFSSSFFSSTSTSTRIFNQFECSIACFVLTRKLNQLETKSSSTSTKLIFSQFVSSTHSASTSSRNQFEQTIS
jgi:hypothetical protein